MSSRTAISQIARDNTAGAAEVLLSAVDVYSLLAEEWSKSECSSVEHAMRRVIEASVALVEAQPAMAPLARLASAVVGAATGLSRADETLDQAEAAAQSFAQQAASAGEAASAHAADLIHDGARVFTHSRSSTVLLAFKLALKAGKRFTVIATESRPMMEGRALAAEVSREGAGVTLIADAAAAQGIAQADFVFLGADWVTTSKVVNKIGTRLIALAARESGRPIHVVCDTSKFIGSTEGFHEDLRPQGRFELRSDPLDEIEVLNSYFEATPLSLFKSIITEHGAMRPEETARLAEQFVLHRRLLEGITR
ncbi:MAG: hypothetical protein WAU45_01305 [Blastocatellia bacterium]